MRDRNILSAFVSKTTNATFGAHARPLLKRMLILAILMGGLTVLISDRAVVSVRAEDCTTVTMDLEYAYYGCSGQSPYSARQGCYTQAQFTNQMRGATCMMPTYSPMVVGGGGCDPAANGQRAYDNCQAGALTGFWQSEYINYLAYYNDQWVACMMVAQSVENQGCY